MQSPIDTPSAASPWRRSVIRLLVTVSGLYVAILVLTVFFENSLVYFPTPASAYWLRPPTPDVCDVVLTTSAGEEIHSWWLPRSDSPGALLYLHGNAGNLSQRGETLARLRESLAMPVLIIDYPGFGKSPGIPSESACYRAADAAYDWLVADQQVAPAEIVIFGKSLGGGVATHLASRKPHRALALVKTYTTLPDVGSYIYPWLPVRLLMRNRFDSMSRIKSCCQPVFVAHGTTDQLIPFVLGQRLYEAANEPKQFLAMEGHGHNDAFPPELYTTLRDFLHKHPAAPR